MKEKKISGKKIAEEVIPFKGYTMEELRYQRAMMALRKEFCKAKVLESVQNIRPGGKARRSGSTTPSKFATVTHLASKLFSNLNTLDYILMGMSLFGTVKKGYKLIKGK